MFITFQNLQLAANLSYSLLNMNIEIKISIDTDTKKLHCIAGNIDYNAALSETGRSLALVPNLVERHLLGLGVIPLGWNQSDTRVRSLCRVVWIVIEFNPWRKSWVSSAKELILEFVGKSSKLLRKLLNNKGLRTDPYAAPLQRDNQVE